MSTVLKSRINTEIRAFYDKNGYCLIEGLLTPEQSRRYLAEADRAGKAQAVPYAPIMNPDRSDPVFHELLAQKDVVACLETLQGGKVWGLQSMLYSKQPGEMGRDMHQDNHYAQAEYGVYLGTWMPLEDTDKENGGLVVYPGSHVEPLLNIVVDEARRKSVAGDFKNDRGTPCAVPEKYEKVYLNVPAGACVFIHGNLIHGSEDNYSKTRFRRVFAGHYITQGQKFISGNHAKRTAIDVYKTSR